MTMFFVSLAILVVTIAVNMAADDEARKSAELLEEIEAKYPKSND